MKTFKRWTASLVSSFEGVIQQIENHEAMVVSAIREAEENGARAKVQLLRVRKDGQAMRKRLIELRDEASVWRQRACKLANTEEAKALECVRRLKHLEKKAHDLEEQEREHAQMERELAKDLASMEERLIGLRQQRNLMRTRQSRAEALQLIQQVDSSAVSEIDDIFMRWEGHVAACEARAHVQTEEVDDLDNELASQEEEESLREMLREITDQQETN